MILYPITTPGGSDGHVQYNNGGVFGGDSTFAFNDATKIISAQTYNATDEDNILQVDGSTFIKTGLAANENLIIGVGAGGGEGTANVILGEGAGSSLTTGTANFLMGKDVGSNMTSGGFNILIGEATTGASITTSGGNIFVGNLSGWKCTNANNVGIGSRTLQNCVTTIENVAIGQGAMQGTFGISSAPTRNVAIGSNTANKIKGGDFSVYIGWKAGENIEEMDSSILIGYQAGINQVNNSDLLILDNQDRGSAAAEITDCFIYGVMNATPASQSLRLNIGNLYLGNPTHSDADNGGAVIQSFIREDGAGTASTAAAITVAHDGAGANDQLGKITESVNTGAGLVAVREVDSSGNTKIGDGGTTNYTKIEADGTIEFNGTATVWDDIRIVPGSFDRPGQSDPAYVAYDVNGSGTSIYLTEWAKNDLASFTVQLPHSYHQGEDLDVHLHWTPGPNGAGENGATVGWKIVYSWVNIDGTFPNPTTADLSDACDGTDHKHQMTPTVAITGSGKTISSMLICNIIRTDTGADDTWAGSGAGNLPMLLEVDFHFPINTVGSRTISAK